MNGKHIASHDVKIRPLRYLLNNHKVLVGKENPDMWVLDEYMPYTSELEALIPSNRIIKVFSNYRLDIDVVNKIISNGTNEDYVIGAYNNYHIALYMVEEILRSRRII